MNLCDSAAVRALLERHNFRFSRTMGQNFLIDPAIPRKIAEASGADAGTGVLEIGPGVGCLTAELSRRAGKVVSVELDSTLLPVLGETLADCGNVEIVPGDALELDLGALAAEKFPGLSPAVCANLPYNIATPVLAKLANTACFGSVTVMIQREVAQRVCAAPGERTCGVFSLLMQYRMEPQLLFDVPRECFYPMPNVTSSVIRCVRRPQPAVRTDDEAFLFRVVQGAFLLRRKTLVNSLSAALPEYEKSTLQAAADACSLPPDIRGERLSLQNFADLAAELRSREK